MSKRTLQPGYGYGLPEAWRKHFSRLWSRGGPNDAGHDVVVTGHEAA